MYSSDEFANEKRMKIDKNLKVFLEEIIIEFKNFLDFWIKWKGHREQENLLDDVEDFIEDSGHRMLAICMCFDD